jgi:hypothetical protein
MPKVLLKDGEILHTNQLNLFNRVVLYDTFTYNTTAVTITAENLNGIDKIDIESVLYTPGDVNSSSSIGIASFNLDQLSSTASMYIGTSNLCNDVAVTNASFGLYTASYKITKLSNGNLTVQNYNKGYFKKDSMAYEDRTTSSAYGFRRIIGYRPINITDVYTKTESNDLYAKVAAPGSGTWVSAYVTTTSSGFTLNRVGNLVQITLSNVTKSIPHYTTIGTIPVGFRPKYATSVEWINMSNDTRGSIGGGRIYIDTNGNLNFSPAGWGTCPAGCQFDLSWTYIGA